MKKEHICEASDIDQMLVKRKTRRGSCARHFGHNYERELVKELKLVGFKNASTSRYSSRELDDRCIDIFGVKPFAIQCKATNGSFPSVVAEMNKIQADKTDYKVLAVKVRNKGEYVVLEQADFLELLSMLKFSQII